MGLVAVIALVCATLASGEDAVRVAGGKEDAHLWRFGVGKVRMDNGKVSYLEPYVGTPYAYCLAAKDGEGSSFVSTKSWMKVGSHGCQEHSRFYFVPAGDGSEEWFIQKSNGWRWHVKSPNDWGNWAQNSDQTWQLLTRADGRELRMHNAQHGCSMMVQDDGWFRCRKYDEDARDEYKFWFLGWKSGNRAHWTPQFEYRTVWEIDGCRIPDDSSLTVSKTLKIGHIRSKKETHIVGVGINVMGFSLGGDFGAVANEAMEAEQEIVVPGVVAPGQIMVVQQLMGEWGPEQLRSSKIKYLCKDCSPSANEVNCTHGTTYFSITERRVSEAAKRLEAATLMKGLQ